MEEADLLADEVAIMRQGELAAFGSPLQLKSEHGTALQLSILVDKTRLVLAKNCINNFFIDCHDWVDIQSSDTGTILVRIAALQDRMDSEGIRVDTLTSFIAWLDGKDSPVSDYDFSNGSLEEVFLKVTDGDHEELQVPSDETMYTLEEDLETAFQGSDLADISLYTPNLSAFNQTLVLLAGFYRRNWTGYRSIGNYCLFGAFFIMTMVRMFRDSWYDDDQLPYLPQVIFFLSIFLLPIIGPVYADRSHGQFYLMKSQGLQPPGYVGGLSLYAFSAQLIYNLSILSGIFASPVFRPSEFCDYENDRESCFDKKRLASPVTIRNYNDEYEGQDVILNAFRAPGGYGMVFGIALSAAFATIGQTLATAFFPGHHFPLAMIILTTLFASVLPSLLAVFASCDTVDHNGLNGVYSDFYCNGTFSRENVSDDFVDCVGFQVNSVMPQIFCVPPSAAFLLQIGVHQMLSMAFTSKITFVSEPKGYVEDVLIPSLDGVQCKNDTCEFPLANRLYGSNLLYTIMGGLILTIIGVCLAYIYAFPVARILHFKQTIGRTCANLRHSALSQQSSSEQMEDAVELPEVAEERASIMTIMSPFLDCDEMERPCLDHSKIPRDVIAPVVMHKLRKVYPAFGGRPPKVALKSLDLHVPKGQILGLLGQNGAGKTTALKILAGEHDSSGGVGLVAGYDCDMEKSSVFDRLGNCSQFDIVWKGQSVQRHLEFFAALKGLPRREIPRIARATASVVGLGSDAVYRRNAGSLSGGMRRRLSIGMSLIGSPSVIILDEPTTG